MTFFLLKLARFILFLAFYAGFIWIMYALEKVRRRHKLSESSIWINRLADVLSVLFFFLFIYLLSGFLSIPLILLFLLASVIVQVAIKILWSIIGYGTTTIEWLARGQWAGGEVAAKQPIPALLAFLLTALLVVFYPIISGVLYFTSSSEQLEIHIFQATLATLGLSGYPLFLTIIIPLVMSENIDEKTRNRYLVTQFSSLISTGLYFALILWAFRVVEDDTRFTVGNTIIQFSPQLIIILTVYFFVLIMIPYLIGMRRAKISRLAFLTKKRDLLTKLSDILDRPAGPTYLARLNQLKSDIYNEIDMLSEKDKMVRWGIEIDQGGVIPTEAESLAEAYRLSRHLDLRFQYLDWLDNLIESVDEVIKDLEEKASDTEVETKGAAWAKVFRNKRDELIKEIEGAEKTRQPVVIAIGFVITTLVSTALGKIAEWAWNLFFLPSAQ